MTMNLAHASAKPSFMLASVPSHTSTQKSVIASATSLKLPAHLHSLILTNPPADVNAARKHAVPTSQTSMLKLANVNVLQQDISALMISHT